MKRLKGKLSPEQLADFDSLILELKALNGENLKKNKVVPLDKIVPLDNEKNDRLWAYIKHYSKLVVMKPKNLNTIRAIVMCDDTLSMATLVDEATMDVAIWIYRFVWRQYEHSEELGYVFTTGGYGFLTWTAEHKSWSDGKASFSSSVDEAEDHNSDDEEDSSSGVQQITRFSEFDFPLSIEDLESSMTNP